VVDRSALSVHSKWCSLCISLLVSYPLVLLPYPLVLLSHPLAQLPTGMAPEGQITDSPTGAADLASSPH
jgi:hypothetical protein